jgi:hypothetical protein
MTLSEHDQSRTGRVAARIDAITDLARFAVASSAAACPHKAMPNSAAKRMMATADR